MKNLLLSAAVAVSLPTLACAEDFSVGLDLSTLGP